MKNEKAAKLGIKCDLAYVRSGMVYCRFTSTTCEGTKKRGMCRVK
jgi:hypothetical protein